MKSRAFAAMLLAYLFPGAGHFLLGRRAVAITFCVIVTSLFLIGVAIDGSIYTPSEAHDWITGLATAGSIGSGVLYFAAWIFGAHGTVTSPTFEYGRMFTLTAGLMNLLLVVDCYDIAAGRK
ncbi:MAG: hypothetical protein M3Q69_08905 [Acidobacteriota bacterium]|nr:hypothetical protein [Acidobacteriota bacterium]